MLNLFLVSEQIVGYSPTAMPGALRRTSSPAAAATVRMATVAEPLSRCVETTPTCLAESRPLRPRCVGRLSTL